MKTLDHQAVEIDNGFIRIIRQRKGSDDRAGIRKGSIGDAEGAVGGIDLGRVDQHLAVKAHVAPLSTFRLEP